MAVAAFITAAARAAVTAKVTSAAVAAKGAPTAVATIVAIAALNAVAAVATTEAMIHRWGMLLGQLFRGPVISPVVEPPAISFRDHCASSIIAA